MMRLMLILLMGWTLLAQTSVDGTVVDQTGGSVANAEVSLTVVATGQRQQTRTDASGVFRFAVAAAGGEGDLQVTYPGFQTVRRKLTFTAGETVRPRVVLAAAGVTETVSVAASAELLQPSRSTQAMALSQADIENMPTASRNYTHLIVAEAGVDAPLPDRTGRGMNLATAPGTQGEDGTQSLNPSVNGARPSNNAVSINGLDMTNMMNGNGGLGNNLSVPLDAVEMIEVQTALYAANTGRNGGGNIQIVTRSGTNQFHGSVFHYLQNEKFNANEFFLNRAGTRRPQFRRNESGVTFGGPIRKDKTFFFASVQRVDFLSGYANRATASTGVPDGLGDVRTRESIATVANKWLASGASDNPRFAANFLTALRAFPADQVPGLERKFFEDTNTLRFRQLQPGDIHPVAINILNVKRFGKLLLPSVNEAMELRPGTASFGRERALIQNFPTFFNSWSGNGTIEHSFSATHRLRLNYLKSAQFVEEAFPWANSSPSPTQGQTPSYTASLSDVRSFGPRWINDFRGGFFELFNTRISKYKDIFNSTLGIFNPIEQAVGGLASLMPTVDIVTQLQGAGIGNAWDFYDRQRTINVANTLSHQTSKHTLQFGGEFRRPTIKGEYMARTNGDLDYDNWVLFFTGHGAAGGGSDLDQGDTRRHFKMVDFSAFVQDDWRVRRGFTINAGVRWDYYGNPVDADGRIGNYYPRSVAAKLGVEPGFYVNPEAAFFKKGFDPLQLGLVISPGTNWNLNQVRPAPTPSTIFADYNNVAPRVGFAWQPQKFNKVVIRAGYGMFYERTSGIFKGDLQLSPPFFFYANVPAPVDMANPYPRLNVNPFQVPINVTIARNAAGAPSWRRVDGSAFPATEPFSAKSMTAIDPLIRTPYVQQWTFNVQFEPVRGNLLDMRYVGSKGTGLMARLNLTQPQDPRQQPVNGFNDIYTSTGGLISPDYFVKPEFLGLNRNTGFRYRSNWGHSSYHAFQMNYRRRMSRWMQGNIGYTFSKSLDNVSSDNAVIEHDAFNGLNNRGRSAFNRPHRFTASYMLQMPSWSAARRLTQGWSLSGMATLQSGAPITVYGNATRNAFFAQPSLVRPDFAPGKTLADALGSGSPQSRLDNWFNASAYADSLDRWGNAGRGMLLGPPQRQFDFVLSKQTKLKETLSAELRFEVYNAFNQATFANPANTLAANGPGTAGRITSTIGGPRTMQTGFRMRF